MEHLKAVNGKHDADALALRYREIVKTLKTEDLRNALRFADSLYPEVVAEYDAELKRRNFIEFGRINATYPKSVDEVNRVLKARGIAERLRRGRGYFYFSDGDASSWFESSEMTVALDAYTIGEWINRLSLMKQKNAEVR